MDDDDDHEQVDDDEQVDEEEEQDEDLDVGEELRDAEQGDMPVDDYCWRLKALADALAEQGDPVDDRLLTLHMLRGLSPRFRVMGRLLLVQARLPSFMEAFARLRMEEYDLDHGQDPL